MTAEGPLLLAGTLFGWLVLTLAAGLWSALVYPLVRRALARQAPAARANALLWHVASAALSATLVLLLLLHPELAPLAPAHCHGELCEPHLPVLGQAGLQGNLLVWLSTALAGVALLLLAGRLRQQQQRLRLLRRLSEPSAGRRWRLVDGRHPLAWCEGIWRTEVYLSRGLVEQLDQQELAVIVAHEEAHAFRRDNLRKALLGLLTAAWPRRWREQARADLALAVEQACDQVAASRVGDPQPVASTLTRMNAGGRLAGRLAALADSAHGQDKPLSGLLLVAALALLQLAMLALAGHPLLEWLAG